MSVKAPVPNPYAAAIYRAQALRFYSRYVDARQHAEYHGQDLTAPHWLPHPADISDEYRKLMHEWVAEPCRTATGAQATLELVSAIAIDRLLYAATREGGIIGEEEDAFHQAMLISSIWPWVNDRALAETVASLRENPSAA